MPWLYHFYSVSNYSLVPSNVKICTLAFDGWAATLSSEKTGWGDNLPTPVCCVRQLPTQYGQLLYNISCCGCLSPVNYRTGTRQWNGMFSDRELHFIQLSIECCNARRSFSSMSTGLCNLLQWGQALASINSSSVGYLCWRYRPQLTELS